MQELQYTREQLISMATEPLRYQQISNQLQDFYTFIKSGFYTSKAIKELCKAHNLDLRKKCDRLQLARIACKLELGEELSTELEETKAELKDTREQLKKASQTAKIVAVALLTPGLPLNGREETPAFKTFNSPTTKDMLINNYKIIRRAIHPDSTLDNYSPETITARFAFINQLYDILIDGWETKYNPTLPISQTDLSKAMGAKLPFNPESFTKYFQKD